MCVIPTPMSAPVKEWVELCALGLPLAGAIFFCSLFGLRLSFAALGGDAVELERI